MTRTFIATLLLGSSLFLTASNTVEGAGRDVQSAGKAIEKTAD